MIIDSRLKHIAVTALMQAYHVHEQLGAAGEEPIWKNQHGEMALQADIEMERAVIDVFRHHHIPIRIVSEEHGVVDVDGPPQYLGILDGLDGSAVYKKARGKARYATMLGIFSNLHPTYEDYVFSGIMEHPTARLFSATKGVGSFVTRLAEEVSVPIHCSNMAVLAKVHGYIDDYWDVNRETFGPLKRQFGLTHSGSSAVHYADLACGNADVVLECTRKGNLEIAVAYGLVREAGGTVVTLDQESLGPQQYFLFGQHKHIPHIAAATAELARCVALSLKYAR